MSGDQPLTDVELHALLRMLLHPASSNVEVADALGAAITCHSREHQLADLLLTATSKMLADIKAAVVHAEPGTVQMVTILKTSGQPNAAEAAAAACISSWHDGRIAEAQKHGARWLHATQSETQEFLTYMIVIARQLFVAGEMASRDGGSVVDEAEKILRGEL